MHKKELPSSPYLPPDSTRVFEAGRFDIYGLKIRGCPRKIVVHPGAVVILPILDDQRIVLIHNERFCVGETLWELPAGTLEGEEKPLECAKRELKEETGYTCQQVTPLSFFYTSPGYSNERMFAYVATGLVQGKQELDETENITTKVFSRDQVLKMIKEGDIRDCKTIAVILQHELLNR